MNVYTTIMEARRTIFKVRINVKIPKMTNRNIDTSLFKSYTSKSTGARSLIFNPLVGFMIERKQTGEVPYNPSLSNSVLMPIQLIYNLGGILTSVYETLSDSSWYVKDEEGNLVVVSDEVKKLSRKMSTAKDMLYLSPTVIYQLDEPNEQLGIALSNNSGSLGALTYLEATALINTIDHIDISSYVMLACIADRLEYMSDKIDLMNANVNKMIKLLQERKGVDSYGGQTKSLDELYGYDQGKALSGGGQTVGYHYPGEGIQGLQEGSGLSYQDGFDKTLTSLPGTD